MIKKMSTPVSQPAGPKSPQPPSAKLMRFAVIGAGVLVLAGIGVFYWASLQTTRGSTDNAVVVTIRNGACEPNEMTVPAGRNTFKIVNQTERAVEWEILDGVMVLEERENIVPGLSQTVTTKLPVGDFKITCGLLSNARGTLHVTPSTESQAEAARPALVAFIGPLAEYQVFLAMQAGALVKATQALDAAIQAGDLEKARGLYEAARLPYMRMEPAAKRFADLDNVIDPVADYLAKREQDPGFVGFHRIEYGLFSARSTDGLAPVSARLVADVTTLKDRIGTLRFTPDQIATSAAQLVTALADTKIPVGEEHYAQTDLTDFDANIEGVAKMMALLKPVAEKAAPKVVAEIESKLAAVRGTLKDLRKPDGFPPYTSVSGESRKLLAMQMHALAAAIGKLNAAVGLA